MHNLTHACLSATAFDDNRRPRFRANESDCFAHAPPRILRQQLHDFSIVLAMTDNMRPNPTYARSNVTTRTRDIILQNTLDDRDNAEQPFKQLITTSRLELFSPLCNQTLLQCPIRRREASMKSLSFVKEDHQKFPNQGCRSILAVGHRRAVQCRMDYRTPSFLIVGCHQKVSMKKGNRRGRGKEILLCKRGRTVHIVLCLDAA